MKYKKIVSFLHLMVLLFKVLFNHASVQSAESFLQMLQTILFASEGLCRACKLLNNIELNIIL